jgi:hypothetical protein
LRTDSPAAVPRGRAGGSPISGTRSRHGGNLPETQRKAVDRLFSFIPFENSPVGIWFKAVSQYLSPLERHATPTSNQQIMARLNEITFNSPLMGELRAIEFIARLIDQGRLPRGMGPGKYRRIYMHRIALEDSAKALNSQSQLNTDYDFFKMLRDRGRRAAHRFLDAHFDDIGVRGTVDLAQEVQAEWA